MKSAFARKSHGIRRALATHKIIEKCKHTKSHYFPLPRSAAETKSNIKSFYFEQNDAFVASMLFL
jgi:hypothetical protein